MGKFSHLDKAVKNIGIIQGIIPTGRKTGIRVFKQDFLAVMTAGEATFTHETGSTKIIKPNMMVYAPAGVPHSYDPNPNRHWVNYWMTFDSNVIKNSFGNVLPSTSGSFKLIETTKLIKNWLELSNIVLSINSQLDSYGYSLLHSLLINLHMQINKISSDGDITHFSEVLQEIRNLAFEANIDLRKIANKYGFGYDNFRKLFKQQIGMSPKQYFITQKINKCKSLLINSSLSIKQISEMTGFENQYYFSRLFKSKTGTSPQNARNRNTYTP